MPRLAAIDVPPSPDGASILDATWQDHPTWESDSDRIAFKAASLTNPESPPYPRIRCSNGLRVRARWPFDDQGGALGRQETEWARTAPLELLVVGRAGVELGNAENSLLTVSVPAGDWEIEAWVDAREPRAVRHVAFVLPGLIA